MNNPRKTRHTFVTQRKSRPKISPSKIEEIKKKNKRSNQRFYRIKPNWKNQTYEP